MTKEEKKIYMKTYRLNNKEHIKKSKNLYNKLNPEVNKKSCRKYHENNKEKFTVYRRKRMDTEPLFKFKKNIRNLIRQTFTSTGFKKNTKTVEMLGMPILEFKIYLENQFEPWMNWNNYGKFNPKGERTWQIDHKIPISLSKTEEEIIISNHYSNLRPLCSKENLDKRAKII